ncbi:LAG1 Protein transporter [Pyrenophora tritici-repentis]|uniref:Ceramide synthase membrane component n=2 Tax=Pyrenophora tritici-repentis TaxID=45151 RepID=A0A2W1GP53_9PLEO|nr:ceramide synthase membrane component [Pyrenophora tritici-repentis]KAF7450750.1 ceramide synthase membrane component [Pyrenophora tritici-repentis]KAF7573397.1 LAG1, Protein transporter TRAM [Pyrenophora tritici-repentis]KAG9381035.1 ceramide synthase membrane component [Pyrenophora tritici-repentis]KAI0573429.1 ceramide synthase membrane component [Pyrenophora tritici-repentis]
MTEPFPSLNGTAATPHGLAVTNEARSGRRRKSSALGHNVPGDGNVPAFATHRSGTPPMNSPISPVNMDFKSEKTMRRSKRRTTRRYLSRAKRMCIRHTWLLPLVLALTIVSLYLIYPYPSNPLSACLFLSYPLARDDPLIPAHVREDPNAPVHYGKGGRDFAFVGFYIIVLSFTREFCMQRLIRPIAIHFGIKNRDKQSRFMEQAYTALYFGIYGPFGIWIMSKTPVWYFNTIGMYENFPHRTHEAVVKAYYLLQASYWAQQAIVLLLMLEKPRKDFKELVAHHVITVSLIWLSYRFHFTYMGIAVYITHDISDFFLATSKCLNYIDSPIVGPYFFVFMCIWGYTRHYINLKIIYSILTTFKTVGPFELNWETQQYKCWISQYITFALLASLQAVNLFWWFFICRIAYRFIIYKDADDDRSEYAPTDEEVEEKEALLKEDVDVEIEKIENAPSTPANGTTGAQQFDSIGSRLKQRKSEKQ